MKNEFSRLKKIFSSRSFRKSGTFYFYLSLIAGLHLVLSTGGDIQEFLSKLITQEYSSIYDQVNGQSITEFQSLSSWLTGAVNPFIFLASIITSTAILGIREPGRYFLRGSLTLAASLTITDFISGFFGQSFSVGTLIECILANALGSMVIISGMMALTFFLGQRKTTNRNNRGWFNFSRAIAPLLVGFAVNFAIFGALKFLLSPTKSIIEAVVSPPYNGYYSNAEGKKTEQFSFLGGALRGGSEISWRGNSHSAKFDWTTDRRSQTMRLYFVDGCISLDMVHRSKILFEENANLTSTGGPLSIEFDNGPIQFFAKRSDLGKLEYEEKTPKMFSASFKKKSTTESESKDKNVNLTIFSSEDAKLASSLSGTTELLFSLILFGDLDTPGFESSNFRSITVKMPSETVRIRIIPPGLVNPAEAIGCSGTKLKRNSSGELEMSASGPMVGLVAKVDRPERVPLGDLARAGRVSIEGMNGWLTETAQSVDDIDRIVDSGYVNFITLSGQFKSLSVNGKSVEARAHDNTTAFGEVYVSTISDGSLKLSGKADAVFVSSSRHSYTRWERLDSEFRTWILFGIPTLLMLAYARVMWLLSTSRKLRW